ncbi:hypothetical protein EDB81DRAFT_170460 [Dactylonectria macrodidyma]|uniref:Uncharacterized protein n=1 Tax=Dactylonectria macrodidyma TaxID=307937 RepID=A0A9P9FNE5_9HYPO|nr:hypothetical protein EDB81DRAFT_170460 [Dactylonectria macrodidyma]
MDSYLSLSPPITPSSFLVRGHSSPAPHAHSSPTPDAAHKPLQEPCFTVLDLPKRGVTDWQDHPTCFFFCVFFFGGGGVWCWFMEVLRDIRGAPLAPGVLPRPKAGDIHSLFTNAFRARGCIEDGNHEPYQAGVHRDLVSFAASHGRAHRASPERKEI